MVRPSTYDDMSVAILKPQWEAQQAATQPPARRPFTVHAFGCVAIQPSTVAAESSGAESSSDAALAANRQSTASSASAFKRQHWSRESGISMRRDTASRMLSLAGFGHASAYPLCSRPHSRTWPAGNASTSRPRSACSQGQFLQPCEGIDPGEQVGGGHGGDAVCEVEAVGACVRDHEMVESQVGYGVVHRLGG